jgi:hypothetical protein
MFSSQYLAKYSFSYLAISRSFWDRLQVFSRRAANNGPEVVDKVGSACWVIDRDV